MKTLLFHVSSLLAGGIEKVLIELLQGLDPARYRVKLSIAHKLDELELLRDQVPPFVEVTYILDKPILSATKKKKINKTITTSERFLEEVILPYFKKQAHYRKLKELIKDVDVIIDFDMTLAPYINLFKGKRTVAYCHFSLGHYWDGNNYKLGKLVNRLTKYDKVVMLCDEMKNKAIQLYPQLKENTVRLYNALDNARIQELSEETLGIHDYLLEDGYFVAVGRLAESQKDFTMLIRSFAACVKKYGIKEHLVIIGDGYSRLALEELAIDQEVGEQVTFVGYQTNPYNWMRHSELFLFCSKYEGLPTVLIEALSLSCPIVATATPTGVQEILLYGDCGILINPGDIEAFSEAIYMLLHDKERQQIFRENAKEILGQFEIKNMVREFERLILN